MTHRRVAARILLALIVLVSQSDDDGAEIFDCCDCTATAAAGVLLCCPQGDGDALAANGLTVYVRVVDNVNAPIANIPAYDIWLTGCAGDVLAMCGGSGAIAASAPTNHMFPSSSKTRSFGYADM